MLRKLNIAFRLLLLFAGINTSVSVWGQEVLIGDEGLTNTEIRRYPRVKKNGPANKIQTNAPFPFFDDFSYDSLNPSRLNWEILVLNRAPGISVEKGLNVPSKGVATFDGANFAGAKYDNNDLIRGEADTLTSNPIDLSGKVPADSVYLSFFFQPGGSGDKPEYVDSLFLYVDTTGNYDWYRIWAFAGDSLATDEFHLVMIPLDSSIYLHANFRMKFMNLGSLNGELDLWHLDYIYLDEGRSVNDTAFGDQSVTDLGNAQFGRFTLMHREEYMNGARMRTLGVKYANREDAAASRTARMDLTDGYGNLTLSGTLNDSRSGLSIPAFANIIDTLGPLSDQTVTDSALFRFRMVLSGQDDRPQNDTLYKNYRIDSVLGYDDGVADIGYGMTAPRGFCQQFSISRPDTLTAVWINFVPSLYYNGVTGQVTSLENKAFKLTAWFELHPDSVLQQRSGAKVEYGSSLNEFRRYEFFEEVAVDSTFWIGIVQNDEMPIGVGFDRNFINDDLIFYEANSGDFVNTNQMGTLMIRCEFGNKEGGSIGIDDPILPLGIALEAFPNPVQEVLHFRYRSPEPLKTGVISLLDSYGRIIIREEIRDAQGEFTIGNTVPSGVYFLQITGNTFDGREVLGQRRLVIAR